MHITCDKVIWGKCTFESIIAYHKAPNDTTDSECWQDFLKLFNNVCNRDGIFRRYFPSFSINDNAKDTLLARPSDLNNFNSTRNESNTNIQRVVFAKMKFPMKHLLMKFRCSCKTSSPYIEQSSTSGKKKNFKRSILLIGTPESSERFAKKRRNCLICVVARIMHLY